MYADDTLLICKADNAIEATEKAQKALNDILYWCEENKLTINREKTKFILVKTLCNPQIKVGNYKLGTVRSYEYLGIILDDELSMNDY